MNNYNFTIENITTQTRTTINQSKLKTIVKILKEYEAKERNNIGDAEEISAKKTKSKRGYTPKEAPGDNDDISIK